MECIRNWSGFRGILRNSWAFHGILTIPAEYVGNGKVLLIGSTLGVEATKKLGNARGEYLQLPSAVFHLLDGRPEEPKY